MRCYEFNDGPYWRAESGSGQGKLERIRNLLPTPHVKDGNVEWLYPQALAGKLRGGYPQQMRCNRRAGFDCMQSAYLAGLISRGV